MYSVVQNCFSEMVRLLNPISFTSEAATLENCIRRVQFLPAVGWGNYGWHHDGWYLTADFHSPVLFWTPPAERAMCLRTVLLIPYIISRIKESVSF